MQWSCGKVVSRSLSKGMPESVVKGQGRDAEVMSLEKPQTCSWMAAPYQRLLKETQEAALGPAKGSPLDTGPATHSLSLPSLV